MYYFENVLKRLNRKTFLLILVDLTTSRYNRLKSLIVPA